MFGQEGADEDAENINNEDDTGEPIETEDKEEQAPVERPRKTSKFMTKYERARILGTRALQIRFIHFFPKQTLSLWNWVDPIEFMLLIYSLALQHECSCDG